MSRSDAMFCVLCARCSCSYTSSSGCKASYTMARLALLGWQDGGRRPQDGGFTGTEGCETSPEPAGT